MTDPNTIESRIARMEESDLRFHLERRRQVKREWRDDTEYRAHLAAIAAAEEAENGRG